ncbi:MAG: UDP-glucose 4-epimerase GalE [Cyanobacteria bacterium P01_H01_bin.119]
MTETILVTGGAGYIGSHATKVLKDNGYEVIVLDNLAYGHREFVEDVLGVKLILGNIGDYQLVTQILKDFSISAVMHFAAFICVGESVKNPRKYYKNNVVETLTLLEAMVDASVNKFIFSSTCATYGFPKEIPLTETHPQAPINPYGNTKLMIERMLADFDVAYGLKSICLRYFNAAGAEPSGLLGEDHSPETHLIPLVLMTALGRRDYISVFGADYPTRDGTCIRDYIHVLDLAEAHLLALQYLQKANKSEAFNLGNNLGFSVKEVIETAKKVSGRDFEVRMEARRPGDPAMLIGSAEKAKNLLGWKPSRNDLETIIRDAFEWHKVRHSA